MAVNEPAAASRKALRWQQHKERTRRDLLDAARKLFAERGFHATSAADIAAAAGVTERTLFRYFPTKLALVLDEATALLPEMFRLIRERPAEEPPYHAICEGILQFGARHQNLLIQIVGARREEMAACRAGHGDSRRPAAQLLERPRLWPGRGVAGCRVAVFVLHGLRTV